MWRALQSWLGMSAKSPPPDPLRWVVLDVESSGLDPRVDRLISIAAVAVHLTPQAAQTQLRIELSDSFEVVLQHREPGMSRLQAPASRVKNNVLVHGIGLGAQAGGVRPETGLRALAAYVADAPLLAYHSWFDQTLLTRTFAEHNLAMPAGPWLDIEDVARGVHREVRRMALDTWLQRYGIACVARHDAAADTLATAELLVRLWRQLTPARGTAWQRLERVAGEARFLAQV